METTRVVIFGAGGFGREVHGYLLDIKAAGAPLEIAGFIDANPDALDGFALAGAPKVLGSMPSDARSDYDAVVIALGSPEARAAVRAEAQRAGIPLFTVKHPLAWVASTAALGAGTIVAPFAIVNDHAKVAENVALNCYASVGHDARVELDAVLSPYATLNGFAILGEQSMMGTHSAIAPGVSIGRNTKVSAGVAIARDTPAGSLVVGAVAKSRVMFPVPDEA